MQVTNHTPVYAATLNQSNWYFVQPTLSGTAGVIIGLVIAYSLGWV
jgi:hypothetical protein